MALRQPNIDRMLQLGLTGMAEALEEQRDIADIDQLGFDDRLAMMIEREAGHRDHKSYLGHLRQPKLRIHADVQDVDCRAGRGIARTTLTQLAAGDWIRQAINLIVGGATGSGKTFVACALAHQACRQRRSVLYRRVPELVTALVRVRDKGTRAVLMAWLREPPRGVNDVLFPSARGEQLTIHGVQYLLNKHRVTASRTCSSLKQQRVTVHRLRHTAAMDLLQAGVDRAAIALWLGHESVETTQIYLEATLAMKERVVSQFDFETGRRPEGKA